MCHNLLSSLLHRAEDSSLQGCSFELTMRNRQTWTHPSVIYYCFGGTHSSVMAAAIHLNWLSASRLPTDEELRRTPYFNCESNHRIGTVHHMGLTDDAAIKAVGLGANRKPLRRLLIQVLGLLGWRSDEVISTETLNAVGWMLRLGGFMSCRLGWRHLSWPLVSAGARRAHPKLCAKVEQIKKQLNKKS